VPDSAATANSPKTPANRASKITAIVNPVSCRDIPENVCESLVKAIERHGATVVCEFTTAEHGARHIAEAAIASGATLLIAVGGDGTAMETIHAAIGSEVPVAIVPMGTGNLLAANIGLPTGFDAAVETAMTGRVAAYDLVEDDSHRHAFAIMGGMGYDALIMRGTPRAAKRTIGKLAYVWTALRELAGRRFQVDITLDGKKPFRRRVKALIVANMGGLATSVKLFPDADPTDGMLDVGILRAATPKSFCLLIWHLLRGRPTESADFDVYRAKSVQVRARRKVPVEFDGDDIGDRASFNVHVLPGAAKLVVPAE
jgi:diacylglycerol kinase (ATP)